MPRELTVTAEYPRDADAVFAEALRFDEMAEATRGVATYRNLPEGAFEEGRTYTLDVLVWKVMHNPNYQVHVERIDPAARMMQSREMGWMIDQWDHTLTVEPTETGCLWTDRILIDCRWATGYMTWVAGIMYRTRHRNRGGKAITMRNLRI